ncbi:BMP family ABC transporter substrate-binding protein [Plantibacter flavus]|uniref:BMP family lipoprotein n=1 Tax=Plantibacter flavus TaxID=150123 RepID=UPI003F18F57A
MSTTKRMIAAALTGTAMLALAGCATAPAPAASGAASDFLPCILSDQGGFDDRSFNQLAYEGVQDAAKELGGTFKSVQSKSPNDYASNIAALVSQRCNLIVGSGFGLVAPITEAAAKYPDTDFAMVDDGSIVAPNVKPVVFDTAQAGFLGGYAAAAYSKTGVVATYGGESIPPVTTFMDGISDGIAYYNAQNTADVTLLGWDRATQQGTFVGSFTDQNASKTIATNFLNSDADVILPIAGSLYQGAGAAITSSAKDAVLVGVDADTYETDTNGLQDRILTSMLKNVRPTVKAVVLNAGQADTFDNAPYVGTLENDGVGLAPFHDFADKVDPKLAAALQEVTKGIVDGTISVDGADK